MKAIELQQSHYFYGNMRVVASKTGIRLESTGSWKFVLVAKAPDWKITVFRNDDKLYYSCTLKQFEESGLVSQFLVSKKDRIVRGHEEQLRPNIRGVHARRRSTPYFICEYAPYEKLVAPQVESIMYASYRMPTCGGVPLRWAQIKRGKDYMSGLPESTQLQPMLFTKSASEVDVPTNIYSPPSGYKLSKSLREVLISEDARESSGDADLLLK